MVNKTLPYVLLDNRTLPELNSRGISSSTTKSAKKQKNKKYKSSSTGHVSKKYMLPISNLELLNNIY